MLSLAYSRNCSPSWPDSVSSSLHDYHVLHVPHHHSMSGASNHDPSVMGHQLSNIWKLLLHVCLEFSSYFYQQLLKSNILVTEIDKSPQEMHATNFPICLIWAFSHFSPWWLPIFWFKLLILNSTFYFNYRFIYNLTVFGSIFILQSAFLHLSYCHLLVTHIESWPLICDFLSASSFVNLVTWIVSLSS